MIDDLQPGEPFSMRCTQDALVVHAAGVEPTLEEIEAADPLIAKAGFTVFHTSTERPNILIAALGDDTTMRCTIYVDLMP